jgi:hypothetical protein
MAQPKTVPEPSRRPFTRGAACRADQNAVPRLSLGRLFIEKGSEKAFPGQRIFHIDGAMKAGAIWPRSEFDKRPIRQPVNSAGQIDKKTVP